ncbi:MAG: DUF2513 domain-containing protein [Allobaculum sp.]|uniref:DUF2513 domain-containing protein n=1 Tax=Allobaculum sp. TaxID=1872463 RepID=UPI00399B7455
MKLDLDLIREIMLKLEAKENYGEVLNREVQIPNHSTEEVAYHCDLLHQRNLVSSYSVKYADNQIYYFKVGDLTWEGHEYLETVREKTRWDKIKKMITEKGQPLLLDTVKFVSQTLITKALGD